MPTVGVAIITHNSVHHLPHCLPPLLAHHATPRILVVNSSSSDGTAHLASELGAETLIVPRATFNHGTTREQARRHLATDIVVMLTPDAYLTGPQALDTLTAPIVDGSAAVAYARQLPRQGAGIVESFDRSFNYPAESAVRTLDHLEEQGTFTFFCSNSCAAWSNSALDTIGGFSPVLIGEDTLATAKLLKSGHAIAYVADACVYHSHSHTIKEQFQRAFDTGLSRQAYHRYLAAPRGDSCRGLAYTRALLYHLAKRRPHLLPYALIQTAAKLSGYQLGKRAATAPLWWKKLCSSQDFYWNDEDNTNP